MHTFKAGTFFVNHCTWQALHKARAHTSPRKEGLELKPCNHMRTCRAFMNHETTAQSTRRYVTKNLLRGVHGLLARTFEHEVKACIDFTQKKWKQIGSYLVVAKTKACLAAIAKSYPGSQGHSTQAKCFECAHSISRNKSSRLETSTTARTGFSSAYCLRFHTPMTQNNP